MTWENNYLVVPEPNPVVYNREGEDMVHKGLTLWVVTRRGKRLQKDILITTVYFDNFLSRLLATSE